MQKDWNEFGADNFVFEILEEIKEPHDPASDNKKEVEILEEMFIDNLQPLGEKDYNKLKINK